LDSFKRAVGFLIFSWKHNKSVVLQKGVATCTEVAVGERGYHTIQQLEQSASAHMLPSGKKNKSKIKAEIDQGWWGYLELFCSPPVLSIYSPPAKDRIMRLEALSS